MNSHEVRDLSTGQVHQQMKACDTVSIRSSFHEERVAHEAWTARGSQSQALTADAKW